MKKLTYNRINGPKKTVGDYLETLDNEELRDVYSTSFFFGIKMPDLMKKMQDELQRRQLDTQPVLF